jgi:opacity protein-like surface antigen
MKKYLLIALFISLPAAASESNNEYYITLSSGFSKNNLSEDNRDSDQINEKLSINNTNFFNLALGKHFNNNIRADISFIFMPKAMVNQTIIDNPSTTKINTNISSYGTMLNAYYDFKEMYNSIKPYFTAGIGLSVNTIENTNIYSERTTGGGFENSKLQSSNKYNLAWQIGTGVDIKINKQVSLDLSYRLYNRGRVQTPKSAYHAPSFQFIDDEAIKYKKLHSHLFGVGLTYKF